LQAKQFAEIDRLASGFAEGAAPALDTLSRRMFTFNFKARAGVFQQQNGSCMKFSVGFPSRVFWA
jgi:hypothetical protein